MSCSKDDTMIFDFKTGADIANWQIEDDRVMGGISQGRFELNEEGHGHFHGMVTVESNGGFSSVQNNSYDLEVQPNDHIALRVTGDGHTYQLRVKDSQDTYYSYEKTFPTSGEWEEIKISLKDMYPSFRGRKLDMPNFSKDHIEEIVFLIGNKRTENFRLLIDKIALDQL